MNLVLPNMPSTLTRTESKILDYIVSNTEIFLFTSIDILSDKLKLSNASISRFAKHVGCKDFKELKRVVLEQTTSVTNSAQKLSTTLSENKDFSLTKTLMYQQQCIEKTLKNIDENEFEKAVKTISKANRIFIHAKNASGSIAGLLVFRLRRMGLNVFKIPSGGSEMLEGLATIQKNDAVILFGFSKLSRESKFIIETSKDEGFSTIAFTGKIHTSYESKADINLFAYRGEENEYHSMISAIAVVDALIVAIYQRLEKKASNQLIKLSKLKEVYKSTR